MPNPVEDEELYRSIVLGGVRSPGQVTITGHDRVTDWDVKAAQGQAGASTTLKGEKPAEVTCTFYLVKDVALGIDDFAEWPAFLALINSTVKGSTPKALDVYHPDLAANGITSFVKASVGGVTHDGKGGQTIVVKFIEYKPPKKVGGSPSGSKAKEKEDPDAAALAELAALTTQFQQTPWNQTPRNNDGQDLER